MADNKDLSIQDQHINADALLRRSKASVFTAIAATLWLAAPAALFLFYKVAISWTP